MRARDTILHIYQALVRTPFRLRNHAWISRLIERLQGIQLTNQHDVDYFLAIILVEFKAIKELMIDARQFPELREVLPNNISRLSPLIISFIRVGDEFIQGTILFVLQNFVEHLASWMFNLEMQLQEVSFSEYMREVDDELVQMVRLDMII